MDLILCQNVIILRKVFLRFDNKFHQTYFINFYMSLILILICFSKLLNNPKKTHTYAVYVKLTIQCHCTLQSCLDLNNVWVKRKGSLGEVWFFFRGFFVVVAQVALKHSREAAKNVQREDGSPYISRPQISPLPSCPAPP